MIDKLSNIWPEWTILECVGEGSFGKVYKAVRKEYQIETYSAIKVIAIPDNETEILSLIAEGFDETSIRKYFQERVREFTNEINLMESLKGMKNIVNIEDYKIIEKEDAIGWYIFIRMEFLTPFNQYVAKADMTEAEIIKLGIDISSALELCSSKNIIHRDIKPQNIFVSDFGDFKLGDFGVAKVLEKSFGTLSTRGTYNYMAPEVFMGRKYNNNVDTYSLGLVLYKLLNNNRLPFISIDYNEFEDRQHANMRRINGEKIPAPVNCSEELSNIILRACEFDSNERFQNPTEFKNKLEALQQDDAVYSAKRIAQKLSVILSEEDEDKTVKAEQSINAPIEHDSINNTKNKRLLIIVFIMVIILIIIGFIVFVLAHKSRFYVNGNVKNNETYTQAETTHGIEKITENITTENTEVITIATEENTTEENSTEENITQENITQENTTQKEYEIYETVEQETTTQVSTETEGETPAEEQTESQSEIIKENKYIVPKGCEYFDKSEYITYSEGSVIYITPELGDELKSKDYTYTYMCVDESTGINEIIYGWNAQVIDIDKNKYEDLFEEIAGEKLVVLYSTFAGCRYLVESPQIPKTVLCLYNTYSNCNSLKTAPEIPNGVESLYHTFASCTSLNKVPEIPDSVTCMMETFVMCSNLEEVSKLSKNVKFMTGTFSNCTSLKEAPALPDSIININYIYENCKNLKTVPAIPDSVRYMEYAFSGCESIIETPEIGNNVISMQGAFCLCKSIIEPPVIPSGVTDLETIFWGCENLETVPEIPSGVINMRGSFTDCAKIKNAPVIPKSVTNMEATFFGCISLETAPEIPDSVRNMKQSFVSCINLKKAPTIPGNVLNMEHTFYGCTGLTGELIINANPQLYNECFAGIDFQLQNLTLTGDSTMLEQLQEAR